MNPPLICEVSPPKLPCNHPNRYPRHWKELSIKIKAAVRFCEAKGCDSRAVLTVHHCNHDKWDNTHPALGYDAATSNLVALCARCHLWAHQMERGFGVLTRQETLYRLESRLAHFARLSASGFFGSAAKRAKQGGAK